VFLRSLTLKGFKSFADPTTLSFEPGVMVVVGPNGSGKSNVVDAVAWVLGAQGPRQLRSAKMDDVIFAGTAKRAALGRAEVTLTIDNSSRRLPVDFAEVTVSRTLFRTGESEYAINGASCRLLDVQELFSDTGVGRQQHVIVGQGQLDQILAARAEDRRMVIEEAAGVLKYRRRRERAERRLESSEVNLQRLEDLLREVRRQLRPLERQAAAARRHQELVDELGLLRRYLLGHELAELEVRASHVSGEVAAARANESRLAAELAVLDRAVTAREEALASSRTGPVQQELARLTALGERARGLANLAAERHRSTVTRRASAGTEAIVVLQEDLASLNAEIDQTDAEVQALEPRLAELEQLEGAEREHETRAAAHLAALAPHVDGFEPEIVERRRGLAALRSERERHAELLARRSERVTYLEQRASQLEILAEELLRSARGAAAAADKARLDADRSAERSAALQVQAATAAAAADQAREAEQVAIARAEVLSSLLEERRSRAGVARLAGSEGVLGALVDLIEVDQGYEAAFEAAVGEALDAVVVSGPSTARAALERLCGTDGGGAVVGLPVEAQPTIARRGRAGVGDVLSPAEQPGGRAASSGLAEPLRRRVRGRDLGVDALLDVLLENVWCVTSTVLDACEVATEAPEVVVVTLAGDRLSRTSWRLGSGRTGVTLAAVERAERETSEASERAEAERIRASSATGRAAGAAAESDRLRRLAEQAARDRDAIAARCAGVTAELEEVTASRDEVAGERVKAADMLAAAERAEAAEEARLEALEEAGRARRGQLAMVQAARDRLDERRRALQSLRSELEVQLAGLAERRSVLSRRQLEVSQQLAARAAELDAAEAASHALAAREQQLGCIARYVEAVVARIDQARLSVGGTLEREERATVSLRAELADLRRQRVAIEQQLVAARARIQQGEIDAAEIRLRVEAVRESIERELGIEPDEAIGADAPIAVSGEEPLARWRAVDQELRLLGPVNALALEELGALQERRGFLEAQLEDVRAARRELHRVINAVDAEIVVVFARAFEDVATHFSALFELLFPGGTGRLSLSDPAALLTTGVEIEARPAGRNVRRLSLLSGGERSLVALAFLFAVFRSRPSPFYLMDEVEAALDDVNLHRFLDLVQSFRDEAQLIVVSHQKRTMEAADVLFGVSMQPGGASKVVTERVRAASTADHLPVPAPKSSELSL
jgi:chromosome segregation protein